MLPFMPIFAPMEAMEAAPELIVLKNPSNPLMTTAFKVASISFAPPKTLEIATLGGERIVLNGACKGLVRACPDWPKSGSRCPDWPNVGSSSPRPPPSYTPTRALLLQIYPPDWAPAEDYNGTYTDDEVTAMYSAFMNPDASFQVPGTVEFCAACSTVQLKSVPNSAAMLAVRERFNQEVARFDEDSEEAALCASDHQVGSQLDIGSVALAKVDALPALCHATDSDRRKLQTERARAARIAKEAAEEAAKEARELITMGTHRELGKSNGKSNWEESCASKLGWQKYTYPTCNDDKESRRLKCCKKWHRCSYRKCTEEGGPSGDMSKNDCKLTLASGKHSCHMSLTTNPFVPDSNAIDDVSPATTST